MCVCVCCVCMHVLCVYACVGCVGKGKQALRLAIDLGFKEGEDKQVRLLPLLLVYTHTHTHTHTLTHSLTHTHTHTYTHTHTHTHTIWYGMGCSHLLQAKDPSTAPPRSYQTSFRTLQTSRSISNHSARLPPLSRRLHVGSVRLDRRGRYGAAHKHMHEQRTHL